VFGASIGLIAILAHSVVDFNMHIPANAILAVALMALISSHLRFATEGYWFRLPIAVKVLASLVIAVSVTFLGLQGWRQATEFVWLRRAARAENFSSTQIQLLSRAAAIEPKNPLTAYEIGEAYRYRSQEGGEHYQDESGADYRVFGKRAMDWFSLSMTLNPWDSRPCVGYGWCLDWLGRTNESGAFFWRAEELDPNNYYNVNLIGLHYVELGDYAAARPWFERSLRLQGEDNPVAANYANLCVARLEEAATNSFAARLNLLTR